MDDHLAAGSTAPILVALSGGSDSRALMFLAHLWAQGNGRPLIALTIDHGLQPGSAEWARDCARLCARLGRRHQTLHWTGPKPATGLPAAARLARHRLLAEEARALGGQVILMGHTADDLDEAVAMRRAGSTVSSPRPWSPSPVWPEGRDIFILRPLLQVRRAALRNWLTLRDEPWIEDPANQDVRYARARARKALGASDTVTPQAGMSRPPADPGASSARLPAGSRLEQDAGILVLPPALSRQQLAAACLCAGGTSQPPRTDQLDRILEQLARGQPFVATLAGARLDMQDGVLKAMREAGEHRRSEGLARDLPQNETVIWDGRFEMTASNGDMTVLPLAGHVGKLPPTQQNRLKALPAAARPGLPVIRDDQGQFSCPILAIGHPVSVRSLALARFRAATGQIRHEADM